MSARRAASGVFSFDIPARVVWNVALLPLLVLLTNDEDNGVQAVVDLESAIGESVRLMTGDFNSSGERFLSFLALNVLEIPSSVALISIWSFLKLDLRPASLS